jgi:hypothetical protein
MPGKVPQVIAAAPRSQYSVEERESSTYCISTTVRYCDADIERQAEDLYTGALMRLCGT